MSNNRQFKFERDIDIGERFGVMVGESELEGCIWSRDVAVRQLGVGGEGDVLADEFVCVGIEVNGEGHGSGGGQLIVEGVAVESGWDIGVVEKAVDVEVESGDAVGGIDVELIGLGEVVGFGIRWGLKTKVDDLGRIFEEGLDIFEDGEGVVIGEAVNLWIV